MPAPMQLDLSKITNALGATYQLNNIAVVHTSENAFADTAFALSAIKGLLDKGHGGRGRG
jgi:hypothetical protein